MDNKKETFEYTYSAKQQQEIENIRKKYLPKEEDKMEQLRRLDRSATKKGNYGVDYSGNCERPDPGSGDVLHHGLAGNLIYTRNYRRYYRNCRSR